MKHLSLFFLLIIPILCFGQSQEPTAIDKDSLEIIYKNATKALNRSKYDEAFELLTICAENGHKKAMRDLGHCYYNGYGVEKNEYLAQVWYNNAKGKSTEDYNTPIMRGYTIESDFQNEKHKTRKYTYCRIIGGNPHIFTTKVNIFIDFGQATSWWSSLEQRKLKDDSGKTINFNSMIDALNYMSDLGWDFVQAYVIKVGKEDVNCYLMRKEIDIKKEDVE